MKKLILLILLIGLLLSACGTDGSGNKSTFYYPDNCKDIAGSVCRVVDTEMGVACYVYFQNAISCVKLGE